MKNPFMKEVQKSYFYSDPYDWTRSGIRYQTVSVVDTTRVVLVSVLAGIVMLGLVTTAVLTIMGSQSNAQSTDAYTTATTVVNEYVEETTTTTTVPVRGQYVCDMPTSYSTEYKLMQWNTGKYAYLDFPSITATKIVFEWHIDQVQEVMDTFQQDIEEVGRYVGKEMRIELPGYVAQDDEFVVPVVFNNKDMGNASYSAYILWQSNFFFGTEATFAFNPSVFENIDKWNNYHHIIVLHELGHLFGLDHTHIDNDGIEQHDSIMSYEGIWTREGYLAGDIAGFQQIFCNK